MEIYDFSNCNESERQGRYGGQAGDKDGIFFNGEYWIIKYPKSTIHMNNTIGTLAPFTLSPLCEYIGSHIYELLGYDVHKTLLGERNGQVVVACKDFQEDFGSLAEIRTLKNAANKQIKDYYTSIKNDVSVPLSATGDNVNLEELILHFTINPKMKREDLIQRFWDCVVIDILLDNNDRNNGNWGLLYNSKTKEYDLAPIFDNGNSFNNKISEKAILEKLSQPEEIFISGSIGTRTIYTFKEKLLSAKKILSMADREFPELQEAILRVVPKVLEQRECIVSMIKNIPQKTKSGLEVCSNARKDFYIRGLEARIDHLLVPTLERIQENQKHKTEIASAEIQQKIKKNKQVGIDLD